MRIIAGALKGRRLVSPRWPGLRPTSDRLRETLFDILGARVTDATVLDAYAGTGAVGIEALSRGAAHVTFVERDPRALGLIAENLARCGVASGYAIIRADAGRLEPSEVAGRFDLILIDPPYGEGDLEVVLATAVRRLGPDGLVVLEHARRRAAPRRVGPLECTRRVVAGDSALAFYEQQPESGDCEPGAGDPSTRSGRG
jgi:16S rRNA (guanine(966)-N(2))-methyltransferase RsmD